VKHLLFVGSVILSAGLTFAGEASSAAAAQNEPIRLSADLDLTEAQQAQLAAEAIKGSKEAARKLANFHFYVRGDRALTLKWFTVGAENGDSGCAFGLYIVLNPSRDSEERQRSLFWLQKAADAGLWSAQEELKSLEKHPAQPVPHG